MLYEIVWLKSTIEGKIFPALSGSAQSDMDEDGLFWLTSLSGKELVITGQGFPYALKNKELHEEEKKFEIKMNNLLKRNDLKYVWYDYNKKGRLIRDIYNDNGKSVPGNYDTLFNFVYKGNKITFAYLSRYQLEYFQKDNCFYPKDLVVIGIVD
jgi:hypothetical protein